MFTSFLRRPIRVKKFRFCLLKTFCSDDRQKQFPSISEIMSDKNKNDCMQKFQSIKISPYSSMDNKKRAAVLIPLCKIDNELCFLYTLRRANLKKHRGQVSFPGGVEDSNDKSLVDTALRETEEELGIIKDSIEVWGSGCAVVGKEFSVLPVLGYLGPLELDRLKPNPGEVEVAFCITLKHLCSKENFRYTQFRSGFNKGYSLPVYINSRFRVWGITGLITHIVLNSLLPSHYTHKLDYIRPMILHPPVL